MQGHGARAGSGGRRILDIDTGLILGVSVSKVAYRGSRGSDLQHLLPSDNSGSLYNSGINTGNAEGSGR